MSTDLQAQAKIEELAAENRTLRDRLQKTECSNRALGRQVVALAERMSGLEEELETARAKGRKRGQRG
jgi:predicted nuclease with TOPRIM domain